MLLVRLAGTLTEAALRASLAEIQPQLDATSQPLPITFDAREMTSYELAARMQRAGPGTHDAEVVTDHRRGFDQVFRVAFAARRLIRLTAATQARCQGKQQTRDYP